MQSRVDTMASQGHRRPRFLLPFCSSILVCGFLDHDHKLSGLRQCHDRLLHEGKIQKNKIWAGDTSCPSPWGSFPATSSINLCWHIIIPTGVVGGGGSHNLPWPQGVWRNGYLHGRITPHPKQTRSPLIRKKRKINVGKQLAESAKRTAFGLGSLQCVRHKVRQC